MPLDSPRIILSACLTRAPDVRLSILAREARSTSSKDAGLSLDALLEAVEEARGRIQGAVPNISE